MANKRERISINAGEFKIVVMKMVAGVFMMFISVASLANEAGTLRLFNANSHHAIVDEKKNQRFLLVLWSLDCSPCMNELNMLGQIASQTADINLVFISTDAETNKDEILHLMTGYGLNKFQQWVFSTHSAQSLRYNIDPSWYGELPRSYFYARDGKRHAVTGRLTRKHIDVWFNTL